MKFDLTFENTYNEEIRDIYWSRTRPDLLKKMKEICEMKIKYINSILDPIKS